MSQSSTLHHEQVAPAGGATAARLAQWQENKRPVGGIVAVFLLLVISALIGFTTWSRIDSYDNELAQSRIATANIARATAEHAESSMELVSAILYGIVDRIERVDRDATMAQELPAIQQFLRARVAQAPVLQGLFVYDEHGRWIINALPRNDPKANNADRAYFIYHRTHTDRKVLISAPVRSRSSGVWIVPVSRRLDHPDGSFAGVALATVRVDYFQQYYDGFAIGKKGAIVLALADGTLITRHPFLPDAIGTNVSQGAVFSMMRAMGNSGSAMRVGTLDKVERLYTFRRLGNYPLVTAAALSKDEIFQRWWAVTLVEAGSLLTVLIALGIVGYRLTRQIALRDRLEGALRSAQAELETSNARLAELATTDPLTGLRNRRYFNERMEIEFGRAARDNTPLAIIMLDIDFFKRYNDTYGHGAGDACLTLVGRVIEAAANRPGDVTARFGGEEFVVLLPDTDARGAMAVADGICRAVHALQAPHSASSHGVVTVSGGVYAAVPTGITAIATFLECADTGLYEAKAGGRNKVAHGLAGSRRIPARPPFPTGPGNTLQPADALW